MNGKLQKTSKVTTQEVCRKWLDNLEAHWLAHGLHPLTEPGAFDMNQAHKVVRWSPDELVVVTTGQKSLRWINV